MSIYGPGGRTTTINVTSSADRILTHAQAEAIANHQWNRGVEEGKRLAIPALADIATERARQNVRWGEQNHPDGTGQPGDREACDAARDITDEAADAGESTFRLILAEEVAEAFAEVDPDLLRTELVQVAAVCVQWIEAIDRRGDHR